MKFRNMIFVLAIAFSILFALMIGTSYAYYVVTSGVPIEATTGNVDTGVAVVFKQSQYINLDTGVPIREENVDEYASKSVFTLTPDSEFLSGADVAINVSLVNVSIDTELNESDDFKYSFSCTDGTTSLELSNGTGSSFTGSTLSLGTLSTSDNTFDISKNYTCTLSIWLQETTLDQNALMGKSFSGLIKVNTLFRK